MHDDLLNSLPAQLGVAQEVEDFLRAAAGVEVEVKHAIDNLVHLLLSFQKRFGEELMPAVGKWHLADVSWILDMDGSERHKPQVEAATLAAAALEDVLTADVLLDYPSGELHTQVAGIKVLISTMLYSHVFHNLAQYTTKQDSLRGNLKGISRYLSKVWKSVPALNELPHALGERLHTAGLTLQGGAVAAAPLTRGTSTVGSTSSVDSSSVILEVGLLDCCLKKPRRSFCCHNIHQHWLGQMSALGGGGPVFGASAVSLFLCLVASKPEQWIMPSRRSTAIDFGGSGTTTTLMKSSMNHRAEGTSCGTLFSKGITAHHRRKNQTSLTLTVTCPSRAC